MSQQPKTLAIVVGGGPAPGINGVIAAATIEARKRGYRVLGIEKGFERIAAGDKRCFRSLEIDDVSYIHKEGGSILGTSRANPRSSEESLDNVVRLLEAENVSALVTIGGDDTVSSAKAVSDHAKGKIAVTHVPKTIDNDLPLPSKYSTFGFQSAREEGTRIVETLLLDAKTTNRWYLAIAMGRKAGHLALGVGVSSSATLCCIPEEFGSHKPSLQEIADIIAGAIVKRLAKGRSYGVAVLAEGLAEILDTTTLPELSDAERDPHGNIRFAEVDFGRLVKTAVRKRLDQFSLGGMLVIDKNVGYELRCCPPNSFDREYTRELGYGAVDFLDAGGTESMITREGDVLVPVSFTDFIDSESGRSKIRLVDTSSAHYQIAREYQIRLTEADLLDDDLLGAMAEVANTTAERLREEFRPSVLADRT